MNRISKYIVEHSWLTVLLASLAAGWLASNIATGYRVDERRTLLETEAQRRSLEIMSLTLNGNLMGSMAMFGLTDADIKSEAVGRQTTMSPKVLAAFESVGRSYDAQGVFLVPRDGVITISWDNAGKPSTGLNVKFRPYFQMAMKGRNNVYAAVSLARGDRALYFSAPVYLGNNTTSEAVGAVVARTSVQKVDELLRGKADIALLMSPQGVVFASSRKEWIGHLSGAPTPGRLNAIRELKQFGNLFEKNDPQVLPLSVEPGIRKFDGKAHAVATAKVQWNDPMGDWSLVLMEDLTRTVPLADRLEYGLGGCIIVLLAGWGLIHLLRSRRAQQVASEQLAVYSSEQQTAAARKSELSEAGLQMQQAQQVGELLRCYFNAAHGIFGALQGVAYLVDQADPDMMALAGSYACADQPPALLAMGEGLLGQCAVEKRSQVIDTAVAGFATIRSGLGEALPAALLLAPLMLHDRFLGVVELALLYKPESAVLEQFEEMNRLLAMNLEIVGRSTGTVEQLAFQQALLDTIPYPVFYKGADTRFLGVNRAYEQTFGVSRDDLIGRRVLDLDYLPEAERLKYQVEDEAIIADAATAQHDMKIPFSDGRLHDTIYSVAGFRKPDGTPGGLVGTFIDVSDVRTAERELSRMADVERFNRLAQGRESRILELKREVNDLCARLADQPRYAAAEMAAAADNSVGEAFDASGNLLIKLHWHPGFESGNADVDREHRSLFAVSNDLLNAIVNGRPKEDIDRIIGTLVKEVTSHFDHEEAIQRAIGYPQAEEHSLIHRSLVDKAVKLIGDFHAGKVDVGTFFQFLAYDVVTLHMRREDSKFYPLFETVGQKLPNAQAEEAMPKLVDLVDLAELQQLFTAFCESVGIAAAIIDLEGTILVSANWQRACTGFHRANADSCKLCIESDTELALQLQAGQDFTMYTCKNGMTDAAAPIIVDGRHLANVFIGQFHLGPPDLDFFRQQAQRFGYPEVDYLQAVSEAPVVDEKRMPVILGFLSGFARMIGTMSLARYRADAAQAKLQEQAELLRRERLTAMSLAEDAETARQVKRQGAPS
ncbi:MAG TPA: PocR ligand-binding domain-containing protein [Geobacteraceae bacterium]